jgi:diguanylate cyclase
MKGMSMTESLDTLTGLRERKWFDGALREAIDGSDGVALAFIDLDYFKEVNDTYGHRAGDEVLRTIAVVLNTAAPGMAFRIGGDEFGILLRDTTLEQAFLRMEAIRLQIAALPLPELPSKHRVAATIGVAQYPRDAKDSRELHSATDAALASAKESGRNQVCLPPSEKMVMKSCYYPESTLRKLKALAERLQRKESQLLREALEDILRKYDPPGAD